MFTLQQEGFGKIQHPLNHTSAEDLSMVSLRWNLISLPRITRVIFNFLSAPYSEKSILHHIFVTEMNISQTILIFLTYNELSDFPFNSEHKGSAFPIKGQIANLLDFLATWSLLLPLCFIILLFITPGTLWILRETPPSHSVAYSTLHPG